MAKMSGVEFTANLARHAKAIADIIRAALSGGWAGAALAAVKHYWPQILMISVFLMLIPVLIFICLPAFIFGGGFGEVEPIDFTTTFLIDEAENYYSGYESELNNYLDELEKGFNDEDYNTNIYGDDIMVRITRNIEKNGSFIDLCWLAAIHSVYCENDLDTVTNSDRQEFVKTLITYSITETVSEISDDEIEIIRTLTITYLDPYSVMNNLSFGRENVNWAEVMYTNMMGLDDTVVINADFINPLPSLSNWRSAVTSEFGYRTDPINGSADNHTGLDIQAPLGTDIAAVMDGTVVAVVYGDTGYGYYVKIDHSDDDGDGLETMYCHCSEIYINVGDEIKQGDIIAAVGSTGKSSGPHLHFEVRVNGKAINPRPYLP